MVVLPPSRVVTFSDQLHYRRVGALTPLAAFEKAASLDALHFVLVSLSHTDRGKGEGGGDAPWIRG